MESFGRLFRNDLRLYVCPACHEQKQGELVTVHNLDIPTNLQHLYMHLLENGYIRELTEIDKSHLAIFSHTVLEKIRCGDASWESMVPDTVARIIKENRLFNCDG